ncbi:DUF1360 domain-containing protein [Neobacillus dielmonensis]|uniref:DUF1360 domain-containing protein n=1 Tax=Neobacillus dielmonensis TaxID=1347369 RepID=UPI0005A71997|nr:DUF1360 domain-containing protein [Neobacillus dielmonensis]
MEISILNLLILSLASFRLTRLVVYDKITEFIRAPFFDEIEEENEEGEREIFYIPKKVGIQHFFGELLSCYWCTGIWTTGAIIFFHYQFPSWSGPVILILAVAGMAAILETIVQRFLEN